MHTGTRLVSAVLLALLLAPSLLHADAETNAKNIAQLQKDLAVLRTDVAKLQSDMLNGSLRGIRTETELRAIREILEGMARQQETIQRISGYGPPASVPGGAGPTMGTITVQNEYDARASVRVNGQFFPIEPYQTRTISVPVGTFQYSVDVDGYGTVEPPRTDSLRPTGYRITIFPRSMPPAN